MRQSEHPTLIGANGHGLLVDADHGERLNIDTTGARVPPATDSIAGPKILDVQVRCPSTHDRFLPPCDYSITQHHSEVKGGIEGAQMRWLAAEESNLDLRVQSPVGCLVTPSAIVTRCPWRLRELLPPRGPTRTSSGLVAPIVRPEGIEPPHPVGYRGLSPACLPVSPQARGRPPGNRTPTCGFGDRRAAIGTKGLQLRR
jgi:hypothetical protein